ncbi:hypothetical protein PS15m_000604 [Mucor circinelloides]
MLNITNASKISGPDYVYQIWLPLFSKLFNINTPRQHGSLLPRSNRSSSGIPIRIVAGVDVESENNQEERSQEADAYGFIKTKIGWFSTDANTEFRTHTYSHESTW